MFSLCLVAAKYSEISPHRICLIELTEIQIVLISQCSIRVKIMSQYCKWDDLKEKMLKIQEEVYFHENRLDEFKTQFGAKLMHRESLLAH